MFLVLTNHLLNRRIIYLFIFLLCYSLCGQAQAPARYTAANVHAHNDYEKPIPFYTAYYRQAGSIEADVFLQNGELYVAHEPGQIKINCTLEALYLMPLRTFIKKNGGTAYPNQNTSLQLLIDLKTAGEATLAVLLQKLALYPEIRDNATVRLVISGNRPAPVIWSQYPAYIHFDGRPHEKYSPSEWQRVAVVSESFRKYTLWNGEGLMAKNEQDKIVRLLDSVHHLNKKFRFWATPDNENTWQTLINLGTDYIGTDDVPRLITYLKNLPPAASQNSEPRYKGQVPAEKRKAH